MKQKIVFLSIEKTKTNKQNNLKCNYQRSLSTSFDALRMMNREIGGLAQ
jgi:hypothetical protein